MKRENKKEQGGVFKNLAGNQKFLLSLNSLQKILLVTQDYNITIHIIQRFQSQQIISQIQECKQTISSLISQMNQPTSITGTQISHETNPSSLQYPYYPPYDNQVDFYEAAIVRLDPQNGQKRAKSCPVCQFPIHILLVSKPCGHYFCYECYQDNKLECGYCGSLNSQLVRANDYDQLWTCDGHCFKVFQNEAELKNHLKLVEKTKQRKD